MNPASQPCLVCGDEPVAVLQKRDLRIVRSPSCGLEWRDPLPDAAELAALYAPGYLERWGAHDERTLARVREMKRRTYARLFAEIERHRPGGRLLDVGCATGFLLEAAEERGFEAYGLDLNAEAVDFSRRRFGERVQRGALEEDRFSGLRFDVVTLVDVFEHVLDPEALLAAARERLAAGGVLVAVMPNAASWVRRLLRGRWPHYALEHLFYWTPHSLERFLADRDWWVLALHTGFRKTFTASYLRSYADCVGSWLPPGLGIAGNRAFSVPTGEMLAIAGPKAIGRRAAE